MSVALCRRDECWRVASEPVTVEVNPGLNGISIAVCESFLRLYLFLPSGSACFKCSCSRPATLNIQIKQYEDENSIPFQIFWHLSSLPCISCFTVIHFCCSLSVLLVSYLQDGVLQDVRISICIQVVMYAFVLM